MNIRDINLFETSYILYVGARGGEAPPGGGQKNFGGVKKFKETKFGDTPVLKFCQYMQYFLRYSSLKFHYFTLVKALRQPGQKLRR